MYEFFPLLIIGAIISAFSIAFIIAFALIKDKKSAIGFDRNMKDSEIMKRLWPYVMRQKKMFILALFLVFVSTVHSIVSPALLGNAIEVIKAKNGFELNTLWWIVGAQLGLLAISLVANYFQAIALQKIGQRIVSNIREDLYKHIESLSHNQLNKIPVGTLVTRVTNDTDAISTTFTNILINLIKNFFIILGILVVMLCINYMLTLMVICFIPFILLFTLIFRKFSRRAHRKVRDGRTDINIFLSENLSGMKIIQIFNREERKNKEFEEKNRTLCRAKFGEIFVSGIFRPVVYMLYISSVLCLFYIGARGYIKDTVFLGQAITSGTIVAFYSYISKFFNPIQNLAEQFNHLQATFASAEKILRIFDLKPEVVDDPDAIELDHIEGNI